MSWDQLSYRLATWGIACDVEETVTDAYEEDPWRPAPDSDAVVVTLTLEDASRLAELVPDPVPHRLGDPLRAGDRLLGPPCVVAVEYVGDMAAVGLCATCQVGHTLDVVMFNRGAGPWKRIDPSRENLDYHHTTRKTHTPQQITTPKTGQTDTETEQP